MPEDADPKPRELENESPAATPDAEQGETPKEPWPVWWGFKTGEPDRLGWWVTAGLPFTFYCAVAATVCWLLALVKGQTEFALLLFWLHLPLAFALRSELRRAKKAAEKTTPEGEAANENPVAAVLGGQIRAAVEDGPDETDDVTRYARPETKEYQVIFPLLFGEGGLETFRYPLFAWDVFRRYEYVGESEGAFVIRLVIADKKGDPAAPRPKFWRRLALALPAWATLWVFLTALDRHGWREDTLAAFFALAAHLLGRAAFRRLAEPQPDANLYLVFDKRVVGTTEAFARLNRHLPGETAAA
jgi:hypothetical protein